MKLSKRRAFVLALTAACALSLSACGAKSEAESSSAETSSVSEEASVSESSNEDSEASASTASASTASGDAEDSSEAESLSEAASESASASESSEEESTAALPGITFEHTVASEESAVITAVDASGNTVWTYTTGTYPIFQVDYITDIGLQGTEYYFVENKSVFCLNAYDGSVLWVNSDFDGYLAEEGFDFDENQTLYIAGWMGHDLTVIDKNGTTQDRVDSFKSGYYNPYKLTLDGSVLTINYENVMGSEGALSVDLNGYVVTVLQ